MSAPYLAFATVQRGEERHFFSCEFEEKDDRRVVEWASAQIRTAGFDALDENVEVTAILLDKQSRLAR